MAHHLPYSGAHQRHLTPKAVSIPGARMLYSRLTKRPPTLALGALIAMLGFATACSDSPSAPEATMSPAGAQEIAPAILSNYYGDIDFNATYPGLTWKTPTKSM